MRSNTDLAFCTHVRFPTRHKSEYAVEYAIVYLWHFFGTRSLLVSRRAEPIGVECVENKLCVHIRYVIPVRLCLFPDDVGLDMLFCSTRQRWIFVHS